MVKKYKFLATIVMLMFSLGSMYGAAGTGYQDHNGHYSRREKDMIARYNKQSLFDRAKELKQLNEANPGFRNLQDLVRIGYSWEQAQEIMQQRHGLPPKNGLYVPNTAEGKQLEARIRELDEQKAIAKLKWQIAGRERDVARMNKYLRFARDGSNKSQWDGYVYG